MNVLITGAAGFLGRQLVKALQKKNKTSPEKTTIIATDIKEQNPFTPDEHLKYVAIDVRSKDMGALMRKANVDIVVHLASIVTPGKKSNREFEYSVDVEGTKNVLEAAVRNGIKRIVVSSSGAAYGYHPDNPEWITENAPIRGNEAFAYSHHKRLVEEMLAKYRETHPQLEQVIFRIGTILGKEVDNQITNLFEKHFLIGIRGSDSPFVFIWDEDVVNCFMKAVFGGATGIYNVAGDGKVTIDEIAVMLNKKVIRFPAPFLKTALFVLKRLKLTQYGEEQLDFLRYRPVFDNKKRKSEFHYTPKYTSREAIEMYCRHKFG